MNFIHWFFYMKYYYVFLDLWRMCVYELIAIPITTMLRYTTVRSERASFRAQWTRYIYSLYIIPLFNVCLLNFNYCVVYNNRFPSNFFVIKFLLIAFCDTGGLHISLSNLLQHGLRRMMVIGWKFHCKKIFCSLNYN